MNTLTQNCQNLNPKCITVAGTLIDVGPTCAGGGNFHFASSTCQTTGTTTVSSNKELFGVDNPTMDLFMGAVLFYIVFCFVVWFFRRKR